MLNKLYYGISEYKSIIDFRNMGYHMNLHYYDKQYTLLFSVLGNTILTIKIYKRIYYKEYDELFIEFEAVGKNQYVINDIKYKSNKRIERSLLYKSWNSENYIKINLKNNKVIKKSTTYDRSYTEQFIMCKNDKLCNYTYLESKKGIKTKIHYENNEMHIINLWRNMNFKSIYHRYIRC